MKIRILLVLFLLGVGINAFAQGIDPSQSTYSCRLFEPSPDGGRTTNLTVGIREVVKHKLLDGVHVVELQWYDWTLNVSIIHPQSDREIVGGASHLYIKLRSHIPPVSVYCTNNDL